MTVEAFHQLRVLDTAGSVATAYCAKLFAAHGAEVVNVEAPESGHPTRHLPPFCDESPRPEASGLHAWLSARKKSLVLDLRSQSGQGRLLDLCRRADVLLEGQGSHSLGQRGLDLGSIRELNPRLVVTAVTWFGRTGPYSGAPGNDALIASMCGLVSNLGTAAGPPRLPSGYQAQIIAGVTAFIGTVIRLLARECGRHISEPLDVSVFEANLCLTEPGTMAVFNAGGVPERLGLNRFWPTYPAGIYPCKKGWIGVTALLPSQWRTLCEMLRLPHLAAEPRYQITLERLADADLLDGEIAPALLRRTAAEWFHDGQAARLPLAMVPTVDELLDCEQFQERGAFTTIELEGHRTFRAPGMPFALSATPGESGGRSPLLGEHDDLQATSAPSTHRRSPAPPVGSPRERAGLPAATPEQRPDLLRGIRIVDLSMGWAGPLAARHLADMGAEVVKVESCRHFDWWRGWEPTAETLAMQIHEKASPFNLVNRNKLGITLDLTSEVGVELVKRLVAASDAVIENYAATVLPKLGLAYSSLREVNPSLVMLSMPPFGASGPWRGYRAYGSTVEQASGLPHFHGNEGEPPMMQHVALGDPIAGITGAAALLVALWHQQRTGEGQFLDLSQVESLLALGAHGILEHTLGGEAPQRLGTRHREHAPHGVYPCRGEGEWITITVTDEAHWTALTELMANAPQPILWPREERLSTAVGRKLHEDELDRRLGEWTAERDRDLLSAKLRHLGVPSAPVLNSGDLLFEPQLASRGFWQWIERAHVGVQPHPSAPFRNTPEAPTIDFPAPTLGQHNHEVLTGILGLDGREIDELRERGVIGSEPTLETESHERPA